MADLLAGRWLSLTKLLECKPCPAVNIYNVILDSYNQYFRHYHRLSHLVHCFEQLDGIRHRLISPGLVEFAIWFHDIVCVPNADSNEMLSAAAACYAASQLGLPTVFGIQAAEIILLTKQRELAADTDGAYFMDIDLAVLGQEWYGFMNYENQIRAEYSHLTETEYRQGRRQVIESFLSKESIYQTCYFQETYEQAAQRNLVRLLELLAGK